MLVPRELLGSVVFLGVETSAGFEFSGIAYFVGVPAALVPGKQHVYLVTAAHCVRDRENVVVRLNAPGGGTQISLLPQGDQWLLLADPAAGEHYVDLAAVRWNPEVSAAAGYTTTPQQLIFDERLVGADTDHGIGIGDEVVAVALLDVHYREEQNAPVVHSGNVAMIPSEPMLVRFENGPSLRMRLYLVELQSGSGLSGMPVFARPRAVHGAEAPPVALLGTLVGPWEDGKATQYGLAKVLPAQLLDDLLQQEAAVERRREAEQRHLDGDDGWLASA